MCRYGPGTYLQARVCMGGGGLCIGLLGCTCAPAPQGRAWGHPEAAGVGVAAAPKLGRLRAPGTGVMGQAGRGKWVERIPRPFPHHGSLGCP